MQQSLVHRYAPFLAIVAMLGLLMVLEPEDNATTTASELSAGSNGVVGGAGTAGGVASTEGAGGSGVATVGGAASAAGTGAATAGGQAGGAAAPAGRTDTGQPVDALGRPLSGDKSKCAAGGLLQETVTSFSLPCMPKLEGDNGGATYQGVTKDEITVVIAHPHYTPETQAALVAVGLAGTDQQHQEASNVFAAFVAKRYELYGRKIKPIIAALECIDNICYRAAAKEMLAKHKPFAVAWYVPSIAPSAFSDEITRAKVLMFGPSGLATDWFVQRRPYAWTEIAQMPRVVDILADYYCKKMWGKNATLAGDPAMRVKRRKLGIVVPEEPVTVEMGERMKQDVSGGMCGSPSDGTQLYTISTDPDEAEAQMPTLVTRMKNDGITTSLVLPSTNVLGCAECDRQQYFPEHLISGQNQNDADIVGRLDASAQRGNRFGIGFRPPGVPLPQHDFRRAAHDVNPNYDPEYITEGPYLAISYLGKLFQLAGPRLTPTNIELGARSSPQIGGNTNPNPWPGWKCCDPLVRKFWWGGENNYSALWDAREIYWSDTAISPDDGQPGAWVCVNQCRRYEVGEWPRGEPKQ